MTIEELMNKACENAFKVISKCNYSDTIDLALNRFKVLSLSFAYSEILNQKNQEYSFTKIYEELIIQCSKYDVLIKKIFNDWGEKNVLIFY